MYKNNLGYVFLELSKKQLKISYIKNILSWIKSNT